MSEPATNAERLQSLWETMERDGFEAGEEFIDEIFDADVEFNPRQAGDAGGRTYRGHDGMRSFFAELTEAFDEVRFDPAESHAVGDDLVIVFTRLAGVAKSTGLPLRQDLSLVYELSGGLVRCVTAYESPAEALEAAERGHADA